MLMIGAYTREDRTPLYGDTDSVIIPKECIKDLESVMGSEIGQLDDEFCGGKALTFTGPALKTYNQVYVDAKYTEGKGHAVLSVTRCKGIPHKSAPMNVCEIDKPSEKAQKNMKAINLYLQDPDKNSRMPINAGLSDCVYVLKVEGEEDKLMTHIGRDAMNRMLNRSAKISCFYVSINKTLRGLGQQTPISCYVKLNERGLCVSNWWETNTRRQRISSNTEMSRPSGYNSFNTVEGMDYKEDDINGIEEIDQYQDLINIADNIDYF